MNIIITGGTKGIGKALTKALLSKNNILVIARDISSSKSLYKNKKNVKFLSVDLGNSSSTESVVKWVHKNWKKVDVIINNAAELSEGEYMSLDTQKILHTLTLNFITPVILTKSLTNYFSKNSLIVNILSPIIYRKNKRAWAYSLSKKAMYDWSNAISEDIKVLSYFPGIVNTSMVKEKSLASKFLAVEPEYTANKIKGFIDKGRTGVYFEPTAILIRLIGLFRL